MTKLRALVFCLLLCLSPGIALSAQEPEQEVLDTVSYDDLPEEEEEEEEEERDSDGPLAAKAALVVRLSPSLDAEVRAASLAVIETIPWVVVGEAATHEIGPRPSIAEITALYEIPGAIRRTPFSDLRGSRGITSPEELFAIYADATERDLPTISNIPAPVELGEGAGTGFSERLRTALLGLARRSALVSFGLSRGNKTVSACLGNGRPGDTTCPPPRRGRVWNEASIFEPIQLAVEAAGETARYFTVLAISRDADIRVLAEGEGTQIVTRRIVRQDDGEEIVETLNVRHVFAPAEPLNDKLPPGYYDLLVIATPEPLPPGLWLDKSDPRSALEACPPGPWFDVCRIMNFGGEASYSRQFDVASVEVMVKNDNLPVYMVKGHPAARSVSLWQAQVLHFRGNAFGASGGRTRFIDNHHCGGAYLGDGFVLTAAHCLVEDNRELRVRLGSRKLSGGGATFKVRIIAVHKKGDSGKERVDLALLHLDDPGGQLASLGDNLKPIALATDPKRRFSALNRLIATGWGFTKARLPGEDDFTAADGTRNSYSDVLQQARLSQVDTSRCAAIPTFKRYREEDMLCLIGTMEGTDTCQGDSGGPVTSIEGRERWLVGIVSRGVGCAYEGMPSVYVNVAQHRGWVEKARKKLLEEKRRGVLAVE